MLILLFITFTGYVLLLKKNNPQSSLTKIILKSLKTNALLLAVSLLLSKLLGQKLLPALLHLHFWLLTPLKVSGTFVILTFIAVGLIFLLRRLTQSQHIARRNLKAGDWTLYFITLLLVFIGSLFLFSCYWGMNHFGKLSIDQIVYHLNEPLTGSDNTQIYSFMENAALKTLVVTAVISELLLFSLSTSYHRLAPKKIGDFFRHKILRRVLPVVAGLLILILGGTFGLQRVGFAQIKAYFFETSQLMAQEYVDPRQVKITFPEKKRNLIYIFLESMESSYLSTELGGAEKENLLPNLAELAQTTGFNFSNTELLGGAQQVPGVGFTTGGMAAQTAGVPLLTSGNHNHYGSTSQYLPGAYSLGEILDQQGYQQTLLIGSKASFGGRDKYFTQHGNYNILDYNTAIADGWIAPDYHVWWGYEDQKLFGYAKNTLNNLASSSEPFNFTMLTVDTHFEDGYLSDDTPKIFDDQYSNVIHYSDEMLGEFLGWIMTQPFYANTTVIISGDHLTMDKDFFADLAPDYIRTVFNLFLNSAVTPATGKNKNRQFSTMDMYPTTLAALGAKVTGERLGLGTNLFADEPTLMEKYGYETFNAELAKRSDFYQNTIIQGSEIEVLTPTKTKK